MPALSPWYQATSILPGLAGDDVRQDVARSTRRRDRDRLAPGDQVAGVHELDGGAVVVRVGLQRLRVGDVDVARVVERPGASCIPTILPDAVLSTASDGVHAPGVAVSLAAARDDPDPVGGDDVDLDRLRRAAPRAVRSASRRRRRPGRSCWLTKMWTVRRSRRTAGRGSPRPAEAPRGPAGRTTLRRRSRSRRTCCAAEAAEQVVEQHVDARLGGAGSFGPTANHCRSVSANVWPVAASRSCPGRRRCG